MCPSLHTFPVLPISVVPVFDLSLFIVLHYQVEIAVLFCSTLLGTYF